VKIRRVPVALLALTLACSKSRATADGGGAPRPNDASTGRATTAPDDAAVGKLAPGFGIAPGERAPTGLHATALDGSDVALDALLARGPTLVVFYRGGWCPYCQYQIHALAQAHAEIARRGVAVVAISADLPSHEADTRSASDVPFALLSDPKLAVVRAFHVAIAVPPEDLAKHEGYAKTLEDYSGETHHMVAVPSMFLVDRGVVRWAHGDPKYTVRPSTAQLLAALDAAGFTPR
jgi:peroxiredoxin